MWKCQGGCWSEVAPFACRHGGSGATSSGGVTTSWRGPSAGREEKVLWVRVGEEPSSRATYLTERIAEYEAAKARGAAAGVIRDAYNRRERVGPIVVRYSAFGPVYD